jgi:hypothetical protein
MSDLFFQGFPAVALVAASLLGISATGCSRTAGPERVAVRGEIRFNDEPLESGRIKFTPIEAAIGPTAVATVTAGVYALDKQNGPVVGTNRIQIESLPDPGFEMDDEVAYAQAQKAKKGRPVIPAEVIPPEYNERSKLVETISADGQTELDFDLKKPVGKRGE